MARHNPPPADAERLLAVYLNDHLAGSTAGLSLIRRIARQHRGTPRQAALSVLAHEVAEDRETLRQIMRALGVPARRTRAVLGALGERAGRLKLNGRVLSRSPLSDVLELEAMRLGVEGKAACWSALRSVADVDPRLEHDMLDGLLDRARRQADVLEEMRLAAAAGTFAGANPRQLGQVAAESHRRLV
ncbi:hypothetical protein ACGF1Z_00340 [Streptomyces sp. NPDC048018]|uniref:hypothetical protein n=1 Tax=Streptomyces sp. NPDC048018 TaxID=3365499 RepID=UPI003712890F